MQMEVMKPVQIMDFNFFESQSSSSTDPTSPRPFGDYYHSTPNSPARVSAFYRENTETSPDHDFHHYKEDQFAFDSSQELDATYLSADQLFDGGIIRSFKPPLPSPKEKKSTEQERGRGRGRERERVSPSLTSSESRRRSTRSLSPFRVSKYPWEQLEKEDEEENKKQSTKQTDTPMKPSSSSKGHRKWRLKDLCLFRSASEGRADPIKKYASLFKRHEEKQTPSGTQVSAHELHYKTNRAVSEDMKKKTFLPYNQGILGRLAFNPALHPLSNGFGFSHH